MTVTTKVMTVIVTFIIIISLIIAMVALVMNDLECDFDDEADTGTSLYSSGSNGEVGFGADDDNDDGDDDDDVGYDALHVLLCKYRHATKVYFPLSR